MEPNEHDIERHWSNGQRPGLLLERILAALAESGANLERLEPEELAPVDEFHVRGRVATQELVEWAGIAAGSHVLDVGAGLGGPSRVLARDHGCRVTGVDLTEEYCVVARELARRTGLGDRVEYHRASALELPFEDRRFPLVWTQHASMNIADKHRLYGELRRVLAPGGRLVLYDPIAGPNTPIHLPVPWARETSLSHLLDRDSLRRTLEEVGFRVVAERDATEDGIRWFEEQFARSAAAGPPKLGLHLLLGSDWPTMAKNVLRNCEEGRVVLVQMQAERR